MLLKRLLFLTLLFCFAGMNMYQTSEKEANLKAAFLYNFTKYIDWNESDNGSDFIIGVIGESPIIESLNEIAKTNTIKNKRILIRSVNKLSEIRGCNILFISQNNRFSLESILRHVGHGVLTVSEQTGYAQKGSAFNFVLIDNKLKFEANVKAISDADLKAGSQLLKLAIIVNTN